MMKTCRSKFRRMFQICLYGAAVLMAPAIGAANPDYQVTSNFGFSQQYREADTWFPSEPFTYDLEIINVGTATAGAAEMQLELPPEFVITGYSWGQLDGSIDFSLVDFDEITSKITFTSAPPGTGFEMSIYGSIAATGSYQFATPLQSATDVNPANNEASQTLSIIDKPVIDLVSTTTVLTPVSNWGEISTFQIEVGNHGPSPAYNINAQLNVWWGLTNRVTTTTLANFNPFQGEVIPVLNPGETIIIYTSGIFQRPGTYEIFSTAHHTNYGYVDSDPLNNDSLAEHVVYFDIPEFDLVGRLDASTTAIQPGGLLTLSMGITNLGPDTATSLTLTALLGDIMFRTSDLELIAIEDAGSWEVVVIEGLDLLNGFLPTLPADESATISIVCRVLPTASGLNGQIAQHFNFSSFWEETEPVPTNQNAFVTVDLMESSGSNLTDLRINHTADRDTASLHQPVTYTIKGTNLGPTPTGTAYLDALIPESMQISGVSSDRGEPMVVGNYVSLSNVSLGIDQSATLQVEAVPTALGAAAVDMGTVSANYDPAIGDNLGKIVTQVVENAECANYQITAKSTKLKSKQNKKSGMWKTNGKVQVEVRNTGLSCAPAAVVNVYQSTDAVLDGGDVLVAAGATKVICPDDKKPQKLNLKVKRDSADDPAGKFYLVVIDEPNSVAECNETDNLLVVQ